MYYCPCGSKKRYANCCEPIVHGFKPAQTPEQLMRSRYSAYTQANVEYILKSMKPPASDGFDLESARQWSANVKWLGLKVLKTKTNKDKGYVEFIAHFSEAGKKSYIHEISEFHKINNEWYYVDGKFAPAKPTNRGK